MEEWPLHPQKWQKGRALPSRGPGQGWEGWFLVPGVLRREMLSTTASLASIPAPSLSSGRGEAATVRRLHSRSRSPTPEGTTFTHPEGGPGSCFPEEAAPKVMEGGREGPESLLVLFFGNLNHHPTLPYLLKGIKASLLLSGGLLWPLLSPPTPKAQWQRRD